MTDEFVMQAFPESTLPKEPAARLARLQEMAQTLAEEPEDSIIPLLRETLSRQSVTPRS